MMRRDRLAAGLLVWTLVWAIGLLPFDAAWAQQFPSKAITMVVGYSPGGQADALARSVANRLSEVVKFPVVVENKPGADGLIAAQSVANARPDGHTIMLATDALLTIEPHLPKPVKWDPSAHLEPVITLGTASLFFATRKELPAETIADLVKLGKQSPNALTFGTSGNATPHRLAGESLQKAGGFQMTHIPYKGTAASLTDLLGGQINVVVGSLTSLEPQVKTGKIKFLGVTTAARDPLAPTVPAISETYPNFDIGIFFGLMAPKNTPPAIIATLNQDLNKVLSSPEIRDALVRVGVTATGGSPADFRKRIEAENATRGAIIRELGIKAD